jgi:hypothetical protein
MMPSRDREVVRDVYDAYLRKDLPAIFALLDPNAQIHQSELLPWGGTYRGHEEIRSFFTKLTEHIDSHVDVDQLFEAGDRVVAVGRSSGRARTSGAEFDVAAVHIWTLRGGKVSRFEAYIDTPGMLRALGR